MTIGIGQVMVNSGNIPHPFLAQARLLLSLAEAKDSRVAEQNYQRMRRAFVAFLYRELLQSKSATQQ
jgi:hypothetical protein